MRFMGYPVPGTLLKRRLMIIKFSDCKMPQDFEWNCNEMKTIYVLGKTLHHYNVAVKSTLR